MSAGVSAVRKTVSEETRVVVLTKFELDNPEYASDTRDTFCPQKGVIVEPQVACRTVYHESRCRWRRRGREGVVGGRSMEIDIAERQRGRHGYSVVMDKGEVW